MGMKLAAKTITRRTMPRSYIHIAGNWDSGKNVYYVNARHDTRIEYLDPPVRIFNILKKYGVNTLSDLDRVFYSEIWAILDTCPTNQDFANLYRFICDNAKH